VAVCRAGRSGTARAGRLRPRRCRHSDCAPTPIRSIEAIVSCCVRPPMTIGAASRLSTGHGRRTLARRFEIGYSYSIERRRWVPHRWTKACPVVSAATQRDLELQATLSSEFAPEIRAIFHMPMRRGSPSTARP
jgi:hypothetical protein